MNNPDVMQRNPNNRALWLAEQASMHADDSFYHCQENWLYWLFANEVRYAR